MERMWVFVESQINYKTLEIVRFICRRVESQNAGFSDDSPDAYNRPLLEKELQSDYFGELNKEQQELERFIRGMEGESTFTFE